MFEFTLRPDLRFSNGSPLTATDVKWSWERAIAKSTGIGRANGVFESVIGYDEVLEGVASELIGVEDVDERVLQIELSEAQPDFAVLLADPVASVVKRENVAHWHTRWSNEADNRVQFSSCPWVELPVGAGPYELQRY